MKTRKVIFAGFAFCIILMVVLFYINSWRECYIEVVEFESQGFCDYCGGCFCFNSTFIQYSGQDYKHTPYIFYKIHDRNPDSELSYYFSSEFELKNDWEKGDKLAVKWCRIDSDIGYRIRGVSKINKR